MLADFSYVNLMPIESRSQGIGGLATCSRSQLQALGSWDDYDREHCDYRPRVRRPWSILGFIDRMSFDFRHLRPVDDGGLYDTGEPLDYVFCAHMNWVERSIASRAAPFEVCSTGAQLDLKSDIEYIARALDQTQPEYCRERDQRKYEDEYFTTGLVVTVTSMKGVARKLYQVVVYEPYDSYILKALVRAEPDPEDALMMLCANEDGEGVPTLMSNQIRLGGTRREKMEGKTSPKGSFLEALDYSKTPTV